MKAPTPNILDRAIGAISPKWAMRRMQGRMAMAVAGGYFGGSSGGRSALRNWNPGVADAAGDISPDLIELRGYSRDLARRSPLAGGALNTVVTNVIGTGLSLEPTPDADFLGMNEEETAEWQDNTLREWRLWAETHLCDATSTQNLYGLQSLAFRSALESGDVFAITPAIARPNSPYRLAVQLIEADRICNPGYSGNSAAITDGIETNTYGAPVACHIARRHPGAVFNRASQEWDRVPFFGAGTGRRNVIHLFDRRRPGQVRGVPYLAAVIEPLKQLTRYSEAEVSAAVLSAAFAVFVKMDAESFESLFSGDGSRDAYLKSAMKWDGSVGTAALDSPGKAVNLLPGEDIVTPDLKRPNVAFDPFVQAVLRQIGVGLELPFEVLVKHFTASYSAARAALLDAWRFFRGRRDWMATNFCQPIYELWLEEAVANGRIAARGFFSDPVIRAAWCAAVWTGDGPGSIDPLKEVDAAKERIALGISTLAAESILHDGVSWKTKHRQRVRETNARRDDGLESDPKAIAPQAPKDYPSDDLK